MEEYGSASLVYSVPLKFQQQPSALVVPYFFIIFFLDAHFDLREREREFSDAAAIFSLHDTRARWIAFKDSYIQGQRSSGRTPHFFSLYCLLVGRKKKEKKKKKRTWCVLCMPQNPAGTYLELCYHLFWLDSLSLSDVIFCLAI